MLAVALVPTIVHSYVGFKASDGKRSEISESPNNIRQKCKTK